MISNLRKYHVNVATLRTLLTMTALLTIAGCAGSSAHLTKAADYTAHSVRTLAVVPPDDLFANDNDQIADAVGAEMAKRGYTIVDAKAVVALLAKDNLSGMPVLAPSALEALGKDGVDAVLSISAAASAVGGPGMRHVKASLTSTHTAKQIGEVNWNNAWGGMPGSIADHVMREGPAEAAREIAEELAKLLG